MFFKYLKKGSKNGVAKKYKKYLDIAIWTFQKCPILKNNTFYF